MSASMLQLAVNTFRSRDGNYCHGYQITREEIFSYIDTDIESSCNQISIWSKEEIITYIPPFDVDDASEHIELFKIASKCTDVCNWHILIDANFDIMMMFNESVT